MKNMRFFDTVLLLTLILLFFTVGFHLGKDNEQLEVKQAYVTLRLEKSKLSEVPLTEGENQGDSDPEASFYGTAEGDIDISSLKIKIDGKYDCRIVDLREDTLTVCCEGIYTEAGFLTSGAKYLSKNQPLEILGSGAYFYGRIIEIKKESTSGK